MVTFQLGGMILLIVSTVYFSGRRMAIPQFQDLLRHMLLPLAAMLVYLFIRTPSLRETSFYLSANFAMSAGFGPNQVSTALGLGMLILLANYLMRWPPLFSGQIDKALFALLTFRALLTFSRGGVTAAILAVLAAYLIYLQAACLRQIGKTIFRFVMGLFLFAGLFWITDQLTGHLLSMRFKGEKEDAQFGTAAY